MEKMQKKTTVEKDTPHQMNDETHSRLRAFFVDEIKRYLLGRETPGENIAKDAKGSF
ncbi:MAG: hypothetical protein WDM90_07670 [Ferruginibacter sp.]